MIKTLLTFIVIGVMFLFGFHQVKEPPIVSPLGVVPCETDTSKGVEQRFKECPIPQNEKATFKGREIAKIKTVAKVLKSDYFIEVTDMKAIPNGVELYARAWNLDGTQIGFGIDGTVDIERFVFINPPIMVDDPAGTIVRSWTDKITGEPQERKLREDPREAILISLAHTIKVKQQKFGSEKIIAGKVGNTTLTAYPQPSTGTAPIDGSVGKTEAAAGIDFGALENSAGDTTDLTGVGLDVNVLAGTTDNKYRQIQRGGVGFDTSSIGSDTIDSAILSLMPRINATVLGDTDLDIADFTPTNGANFPATDYNAVNWSTTTRYATGIAISASTADVYSNFTLNASGRAEINGSGNTFYGLMLKWDFDNNFTGTWVSADSSRWQPYQADQAGTTKDPKLVVEHTAAVATAVGEEYLINFD